MGNYFVYILASPDRMIYVGRTDNLRRAISHHRAGQPEFLARSQITRLVHYEEISEITAAIGREKELKSMGSAQKTALIEQRNSKWDDLAAKW